MESKRVHRKVVAGGKARIKEFSEDFIFMERRIITGMVVSTDYITQIRQIWNPALLTNRPARQLGTWCIEFYDKYRKAPGKDIESVLEEKSKKLNKDIVEDIEQILTSLSDEYSRQDKFNVSYLLDQTREFLQGQNIDNFVADIKAKLDKGELDDAKKLIHNFRDLAGDKGNTIDFSDKSVLANLGKAFKTTTQSIVRYPKQLGRFLNNQLVRGAFVSFMGPEKRGKTFTLLDLAVRAAWQGANVAFFQAGDMTEDQFLKRVAIHKCKKSDLEKFCGQMYEPVRDCIFNQLDICEKPERECEFGVIDNTDDLGMEDEAAARRKLEDLTFDDLVKAYESKENRRYKACHNCIQYQTRKWGAVWYKKIDVGEPLKVEEARRMWRKFFIKNKRRFKLSTHATYTLTVTEMENTLDMWEKTEGFVADLIMVDYVDIMAPENPGEDKRNQENHKWMRLRALSQKKHALVISPTQTDAGSYEAHIIKQKHFSEDKRKYGHVTAMYGLNQDPSGKEKKKGIMRINAIVVREDEFTIDSQVYVLQNLKRGLPVITSYF